MSEPNQRGTPLPGLPALILNPAGPIRQKVLTQQELGFRRLLFQVWPVQSTTIARLGGFHVVKVCEYLEQ
eukprot:5974571-Amphidinium_carterae.1